MTDMGFKVIDKWVVVVHNHKPPGQRWTDFIGVLSKEVIQRGVSPASIRFLVYSDGGGPNATERKALNDLTSGASTTAVLTPSTMAKMIVSAFTLFHKRMRAFAPDQIDEAFRYIGATAIEQETIWREMKAVAADVTGVQLPDRPRERTAQVG